MNSFVQRASQFQDRVELPSKGAPANLPKNVQSDADEMPNNDYTAIESAVKNVMFHVTMRSNLPSIKANGLLPSKKPKGFSVGMKNYQANSIYFCSTIRGARDWIRMLSSLENDLDEAKIRQMCILQVDVSKWVSKFKEDPDFEVLEESPADAYFLKNTIIPPSNILKVIGTGSALKKIKTEESYNLWELTNIFNFTPPKLLSKLKAYTPSVLKHMRKALDSEMKRRAGDKLAPLTKGHFRLSELLTKLGYPSNSVEANPKPNSFVQRAQEPFLDA